MAERASKPQQSPNASKITAKLIEATFSLQHLNKDVNILRRTIEAEFTPDALIAGVLSTILNATELLHHLAALQAIVLATEVDK